MNFGCGSEVDNVVSMYLAAVLKEGECLLSKDSFVFGGEVVKFGVEFFYFFFVVVGDVFVDLSVSKMFVDALFDTGISQHDDDTHVLICPDCYEFFVVG